MAFIELDQREVLNRDQTEKKNLSAFDTFPVKAISKASPSATHINLQNAITEACPVFYCCAVLAVKAAGRKRKHFVVNQISDDLFLS